MEIELLTPENVILKTRNIGSPQISGNGGHIVYTLGYIDADTKKKRSDLWLMKSDGGENRQLTWEDEQVSSPIWSPDDETIAFVSARDGEHTIRLLSLDGGEAQPIATHIEAPTSLAWSPDGTHIAYTLKVDPDNPSGAKRDTNELAPVRSTTRLDYKQDSRGYLNNVRTQLFVVNLDTHETRQLTEEYKDHTFPNWSRDSKEIAIKVADQNGMRSWLKLYPLAGGEPRKIGWPDGIIGLYSWSPDGSQILFTGYPTNSPQHEFWRYLTATGEVVQVTDGLDFQPESGYPTASSPSQPVWIDDDKVIVNSSFQGMTSLFGLDVTDGVDVQVTIWKGIHSGLSTDNANTTIVQAYSSPETPARLVKVDIDSHEVTTLLDPNESWLSSDMLPKVEHVSVERGDKTIDAWVYLPPNIDTSRKYPVILNIHGGPHNHHGFNWNTPSQLMSAAGNIVISPNPRGSGTYGREFAESVWGDWGGEDWLDDLAILDLVLERDYADSERCGIYGYSYGGFIASWAIGQTDRFKAAIVGAPVYNFYSFFGTSDIGHTWCEIQFGGDVFDPEQAPAVLARSPHTHIRNAKTPTLIMQGEEDHRCPVGQAEELFVALKKLGVETELVRYPGCSHLMLGSGPTEYKIDYHTRVIEWFGERL